MRQLAFLLFCTFILAGCLSSPSPKPYDDPAPEHLADAPPAGTPSAEASPGTTTEEGNHTQLPPPRIVRIAADGKRSALVAWCGPDALPDAVECFVHSQRNGKPVVLPRGNITHASLVITWDATSPLTEELRFAVFADYPNGSAESLTAWVTGPSPLAFDLDMKPAKDVPRTKVALYSIPVERRQDPAVVAVASTDQPWHVEGTLTIQPEAGRETLA